MKIWVQSMLIIAFMFVANSVSAHTDLSSTTPGDGEEISEPVSEITLSYSGKIEDGSSFEIQNELGEMIDIERFTVVDGVLTGTLSSSLENGSYTVKWNSISEDGHPLNGSFSFTVAAVEEKLEEQVVEVQSESSTETVAPTEESDTRDSSPFLWILGLMVLVLLGMSIFLITKRKRM